MSAPVIADPSADTRWLIVIVPRAGLIEPIALILEPGGATLTLDPEGRVRCRIPFAGAIADQPQWLELAAPLGPGAAPRQVALDLRPDRVALLIDGFARSRLRPPGVRLGSGQPLVAAPALVHGFRIERAQPAGGVKPSSSTAPARTSSAK